MGKPCPVCQSKQRAGIPIKKIAEAKKPGRAIYRQHFLDKLPICMSNQCGNYGQDAGCEGCLLIGGKPCKLEKHLLHGGGCKKDPPLFLPAVDDGKANEEACDTAGDET